MLEKCKVLKEYAQFVAVSRQYVSDGLDMKTVFMQLYSVTIRLSSRVRSRLRI